MIDTKLLYYLIAVSDAGTLTKAAQKLHLSQQALGRSMRRLEEELHIPLFHRSKNRMELNEYGKVAVQYEQKILDQLEEMETTIKMMEKQNHTISIGSMAPRPLYSLYKVITSLYENIRLETELTTYDSLIKGLYDQTYQIIISSKKINDQKVVCQLWGSEELYFLLPTGHPLAAKKALSFKDMDGETLILYNKIGFWKNLVAQLMPNAHFIIIEDRENFRKLLEHSDMIAFTTDLAIEEEGKIANRIVKEIKEQEALVPFYCMCLADNYPKCKDIFRSIAL